MTHLATLVTLRDSCSSIVHAQGRGVLKDKEGFFPTLYPQHGSSSYNLFLTRLPSRNGYIKSIDIAQGIFAHLCKGL